MERQALYQSFKTLNWQQQLGNLASNIAAISTQSMIPQHDKLTRHLLREAALLIEWCAFNVPSDLQLELAQIQREIMAWHKIHPLQEARDLLSLQTRHQSDRILQMSGLLQHTNENVEQLTVNS
ncbi:hypothetical protein PN499_19280 [Kamptonema animale CS-326]|jgi:hypothetical protein|uniref:hypothetical protein n=1 Tax=Kamptonema animale TaxID=92934 RepID=UPI00232E2FFE|nr:hypothetical protein [Kamptonema animale]MDB9513340.1 hypothetical protein [Kamptonema animale CS-326]